MFLVSGRSRGLLTDWGIGEWSRPFIAFAIRGLLCASDSLLKSVTFHIPQVGDFRLWIIPWVGGVSCDLRPAGGPMPVAQDSCVHAGTLRHARVS